MSSWIGRTFGRIGGGTGKARSALIRRYDAYLQVLRANADVLALLAELEEIAAAPGATGRQRVKALVIRIGVQVYAMARMLQVLGGQRYASLFPAIERIRTGLESALEEPARPPTRELWTVPLAELAAAGEEVVGGKAAKLGRMYVAGGAAIPDGFAVTVEAFRAVLWHNRLEETVRVLSDALDPDEPAHLVETAERIQRDILRATLPTDITEAILGAAETLARAAPGAVRFSVRSSATGEDGDVSYAGQYTSVLEVPADQVTTAYLQVLAGFFNPRAVLTRLRRGHGPLELGMGALVMIMVEPRVSGVAYSCDPLGGSPDEVVVEAVPGSPEKLVGGAATPASWRVNRARPSVPRLESPPSRQSSPTAAEIEAVARLALKAEEVLGRPADVEWAIDAKGTLWLLQARPLAVVPAGAPEDSPPVSGRRVLVQRGVCASPGVGAGLVARVHGREDALLLRPGSILVAAEAIPDLALALPRAAAVVTERGSVTGHLAATAREFGVPALFAVDGALATLEEGMLVTVDARSRRIYEGTVEELEALPTATPARATTNRSTLAERVLPLILPLNLKDPEAREFTPEHCQTLHDLVRFIHEKALMETLGIAEGVEGSPGEWYRVAEPLPFELRLVPLEGGVSAAVGSRTVKRGEVTSVPTAAFLDGLLDPAVKRDGPPPLDAAGFMSVLSHSAFATDLGGPTWGMVSDRYLQLSSRIGYHFTTLEALVDEKGRDSRISFVFRGGAADELRRAHRARFIARVLEGLGFQVNWKGDYVSGVFGHASAQEACSVLSRLGQLLVLANRLDALLADGTLADRYAECFLQGDYGPILRGDREPQMNNIGR
ncbi:MAG: hypothetical protein HRF46_13240 [Acidobacteriota bacterium]|jgi:pyruvate,water dikinase